LYAGKYRQLSRLIFAQMMHESARGKSSLARDSNNYFGMSTAKNRFQLGRPGKAKPKSEGGGTYQEYNSFLQSYRDYLRLLKIRDFPTKPHPKNPAGWFAAELKKRNYYTDSELNYTAGLMRFL
jgi:flagellum-specific peptidoglycan hydrolase FlgJ